jgi:hypothetical protein
MSRVGFLGAVGLVVIVLALLAWIIVVIRAGRSPVQTEDPGGKLKRGPVSGGAIRGDPGQNILTGEAPRQDEEAREGEKPRNSPMDL